MTEIYLHSVARMADYMGLPGRLHERGIEFEVGWPAQTNGLRRPPWRRTARAALPVLRNHA